MFSSLRCSIYLALISGMIILIIIICTLSFVHVEIKGLDHECVHQFRDCWNCTSADSLGECIRTNKRPNNCNVCAIDNKTMEFASSNDAKHFVQASGIPKNVIVEQMSISNNKLRRIPCNIFKVFPWVESFEVTNTSVDRLLPDDFQNAKKLKVFYAHNNLISALRAHTFYQADNLLHISFEENKLSQIDKNAFMYLHKLKYLSISENLKELHPHTFKHLINMQVLKLNHNLIKVLPDSLFESLRKLRLLELNFNKILDFNNKTFRELENLELLSLEHNELRFEPITTCFNQLIKLERLILNGNEMPVIGAFAFVRLINLKELELQEMDVRSIVDFAFEGLVKLIKLNLNDNELESIGSITFSGLRNLRELRIKNNVIKHIDSKSFIHLKKMQLLLLDKNECIDKWWTSSIPVENDIASSRCANCVVPKIEHGRLMDVGFGDFYATGDYISRYQTNKIVCHRGYSYIGKDEEDDIFSCAIDRWNKEFPKCIKLCPVNFGYTTNAICHFNGTSTPCIKDQAPNTIAELSCKEGYQITTSTSKSRSLKCLSNGEWDKVPVECKPICGRLVPLGSRFGGRTTSIFDVPWFVAIYEKHAGTYDQICGGSIITKRIVLSANHCVYNDDTKAFQPKENYKVVAGKNFRAFDAEEKHAMQIFDISEIRSGPSYNGFAAFYQSDISILIVDRDIQFEGRNVKPICIDFSVKYGVERIVPAGEKGLVSGFGFKDKNGNPTDQLKSVEIPVVDFNTCLKEAGDFRPFVINDKFCSGIKGEVALSQGDSGGPWYFPKEEDGQTVYYLRGIVSNSRKYSPFYTLFTNVLEYVDYIKDAVREYP